MKYTKTKKSILSKIAVIALISVTGSYTYTNHAETSIDHIIHVFIPTERNLSGFFNSSNKTPYNTFVEELETILRDFKRKIEAITRNNSDELSTSIEELMDYVSQHFNILCNIFKKYNGKPASYASDFSVEIKREFNTEKIFGEMICKLKILRGKAVHADNKHLVKKIDCLTHLIQKKKSEWNAKKDWVLFAGLTNRMKCV